MTDPTPQIVRLDDDGNIADEAIINPETQAFLERVAAYTSKDGKAEWEMMKDPEAMPYAILNFRTTPPVAIWNRPRFEIEDYERRR